MPISPRPNKAPVFRTASRLRFAIGKTSLLIGMAACLPIAAKATAPSNAWGEMTTKDAEFVSKWISNQSISAVYPAPAEFSERLAEANRVINREAAQVTSYEGYRQALNHFVGSFDDRHLRLSFSVSQTTYNWPGFFLVYRGGRYLTSGGTVIDNDHEVSQCDDKPMSEWVHQIASYEQMTDGLESTRANAAPLIFKDAGSPFIKRPTSCIIAGKQTTLAWVPVASSKFIADVAAANIISDRITEVRQFGRSGAWVRMGIFSPKTQAEGKSFKNLIATTPSLRQKSVVVIDVRGNGGGPYEWFMGFLRALYGSDYVDYYARARLQISEVYRATPEILSFFSDIDASETGDLTPPPDGSPVDDDNISYKKALHSGQAFFITPKNSRQIAVPKSIPTNIVKAKVYVLTDYRCGSACIGFVDEVKKIPGVEQIGVETFVDSRTGTPFGAPLPSGNGIVGVPVMTRDGRERGDNVPQKPMHVFNGNITDTEAIRAWINNNFINQ